MPDNKVLGMVEPAEFRSRTAAWGRRKGDIELVDAAYEAYYRSRTPDNADKLHQALHQYLLSHGRHWDKISRNVDSGGLMKFLYDMTAPVKSKPVTAQERAYQALQSRDIPHSRYGVLYLLGSIDIELDTVPLVLETVGAIGGAAAAGVGTNMGAALTARTQAQVDAATVTAFTTAGTAVSINSISGAGKGLVKVGAAIMSNGGSVAALPPPTPATSNSANPWFPCSADALKMAAAAIPETYQHNRFYGVMAGIGAGIAAPVVLAHTVAADIAIHAINAPGALIQAGSELFEKIRKALNSGWEKIKAKMLADGSWKYEQIAAVVKAGLKFVLDIVMKSAAPFVGAALELGSGVVRAIDMTCTRVASYLDRRNIHLNPGHPEEIANSIEHAMNMGILSGLVDAIKASGKIAVQSILPGLGSVVSAIMTGLEWLVKLIYRVWESYQVKDFLAKARALFVEEKSRAKPVSTETVGGTVNATQTVTLRNPVTGVATTTVNLTFGGGPLGAKSVVSATINNHTSPLEPDLRSGGIITNAHAFTDFFREGCNASPMIPILVLNSGICGSLMTLIKLFDDTGEMDATAQEHFNTANQYFSRLKQFGAVYLRTSGFQFKPLNMEDGFLRGLLRHAVDHHNPANSMLSNVVAVARA